MVSSAKVVLRTFCRKFAEIFRNICLAASEKSAGILRKFCRTFRQFSATTPSLREKQRGVENSGEGKTYHKTPSQKRFWTPPPMIRFPPPVCFRPVVFLCEFWDVVCPGFAPNPFCFSFWFWSFLWFFLVGRSGRCRLRGVARLAPLLLLLCMRKACIIRDGGRWPRQPPPPLGSSLQPL